MAWLVSETWVSSSNPETVAKVSKPGTRTQRPMGVVVKVCKRLMVLPA
jgi:hypothetical protein